jgi:hypothetical protein
MPAGCAKYIATGGATSAWAYVDPSGKLAYKPLPAGDAISDYSYAGYGGGGVALPVAPVQKTLMPSGGDDTAAIQAAIDAVSKMAAGADGIRGAVLLGPGTFQVSATVTLSTSGVVLRGSGSATGGTVVNATGSPRYVFAILGSGSAATGTSATITDTYVPSGARTFHVSDATGLAAGTPVHVNRPVTAAWIHFMGMDTLVRNGAPQTWISAGSIIAADRVVVAVSGNEVTVDAPLTDSLDAKYVSPPGATVAPYTFAGRISNVGLESMHVVVPQQSVPISSPTWDILNLDAVVDGWVKDVLGEEPTEGFDIGSGAKRVTIEDCSIVRTAAIDGSAGYPFAYSVDGQQVLVQRSSAQAAHVFAYATKSRTPGPNVVLDFAVNGGPSQIQPHERWATGLLVDGANVSASEIDLMNRGYDGSGHGWTIGFGVVWNSTANALLIQQPPGSTNWAIGSTGTLTQAAAPGTTTPILPEGTVDSPGKAVAPKSLYLAQLCERLGPDAVSAIGY